MTTLPNVTSHAAAAPNVLAATTAGIGTRVYSLQEVNDALGFWMRLKPSTGAQGTGEPRSLSAEAGPLAGLLGTMWYQHLTSVREDHLDARERAGLFVAHVFLRSGLAHAMFGPRVPLLPAPR